MSALIRQSHANNQDPLWASAQGSENIVTDEITINQGGSIILDKQTGQTVLQEVSYAGMGPGQSLSVTDENGDYDVLQVGDLFVFGKGGNIGNTDYVSFNGNGPNFGLSFGTSLARNVFFDIVNGELNITPNSIGPIPTTFCNTTVAVGPVPTAPNPFADFLITNPYPTTSGQEYDFACRGVITLSSGTPDATLDDIFVVKVVVGGATTGTQNYIFNPNAGTWYVRDRLICTVDTPSITVSVQNVQRGTSTAVYDCNMTMGDIVRVK